MRAVPVTWTNPPTSELVMVHWAAEIPGDQDMADGNIPVVLEGLLGVMVECGRSLVMGAQSVEV